jgi:hypothetical protein
LTIYSVNNLRLNRGWSVLRVHPGSLLHWLRMKAKAS